MNVTFEMVSMFVLLVGFISAAWWRIDGQIKAAKTEAEKKADAAAAMALHSQSQLAEYKTHVAEVYITKSGMRETRDEIMGGVTGLGRQLAEMTQRIDQIIMHDKRPATGRPRG